jgi:esterase/lipase
MPAGSYEEAVRRFEVIEQEEAEIVNAASRSLLLVHGEPTEEVYVLMHGLSASPRQWDEFGNILYERGYNVLIPRMPHHGLLSNEASEMKVMQVDELRYYGDEAVDIARGLGGEITVIGLSGGGTVTAWIGQYRPDVTRVLGLSPFFGVPEGPQALSTFIMNLTARIPSITLNNPSLDQRDWRYRGQATRAVSQYLQLGKSVFEGAEREAPLVPAADFLMTEADQTADNEATVELASLWADAGIDVSRNIFPRSLEIPHASIEPGVDPEKRALVYAKILEMLGEGPLE